MSAPRLGRLLGFSPPEPTIRFVIRTSRPLVGFYPVAFFNGSTRNRNLIERNLRFGPTRCARKHTRVRRTNEHINLIGFCFC